jgi:DNA-binding transcriptional LysR family regulator
VSVPLELRHLRYFVAVAEEGQMSRAAGRLHLAQPALSRAIDSLERQLGIRLLVRLPRGVQPTAAGRLLHTKALTAIAAFEAAEVSMRALARADRGRLIVGLPRGAFELLCRIRGELARRDPGLELEARELHFRNRLVELRAGRMDAEIVSPAPELADLAVEVLLRSPRVALLWADHPLASRSSIRFEEIANETFPRLHPDLPAEWADFHLLTAERGHLPATTRQAPETVGETWSLIVNRQAISVKPQFVAAQYARAGVVAVPVLDIDPVVVGLAYRRDDARATVSALADAARAVASGRRAVAPAPYTSPDG